MNDDPAQQTPAESPWWFWAGLATPVVLSSSLLAVTAYLASPDGPSSKQTPPIAGRKFLPPAPPSMHPHTGEQDTAPQP